MNYKESINWLYSFDKFGIKLGLERITYICKKLNNPHKKLKIIHVGGTNGKGSVCKFLQSILTLNGYCIGVYTSPHLIRFSERFTIDDKEISNSDIVLLVKKIKPIIDEMIKKNNTPTFFEIVTAMAFEYFKLKEVDYAIVEVGLGGRFDATNIVNPIVTVITNISLEHQDRLGEKIEDIAFEKAGIIKKGIPVITAASGKALDIIKKRADEKKSSITIIDKHSYIIQSGGIDWQQYLIICSLMEYYVKVNIAGNFQGENLALTIATIEILQINGIYISDESIIEGIEKTKYPGRMEIIGFEPIILLDGAHNIEGIKLLKDTIKDNFIFEKLILIIGILSDKNVLQMLDIITYISDTVILTKSKNKRASDPQKLKEQVDCKNVIVKDEIPEAIKYAKKIASKQDLILITGSLFTVGEAKEHLQKS